MAEQSCDDTCTLMDQHLGEARLWVPHRAGLTERVLRRRLEKQQQLRLSNWQQRPLSAAQLSYAGDDAYASLRIYEVYIASSTHEVVQESRTLRLDVVILHTHLCEHVPTGVTEAATARAA